MCTASYCTYCSCPDPWGTAFIVDVNQIDGFTTWVLRLSACSNNPDLLPKKANKIVAMQELLHNSAFLHLASQNATLIELSIIVCAGRRSCSSFKSVQVKGIGDIITYKQMPCGPDDLICQHVRRQKQVACA